MDNREAVNWLINISADIGKAEHSDLWHYEQALTEIKDMLESAQLSQEGTTKDATSDTISRQAAITALSHMCSEDEKGLTVSRANVDSMLKSLLPAQPEERTDKRTETRACDLISRQAAIDALNTGFWGVEWDKALATAILKDLPSAQPERTCVNCGRTVNNGGWYADGRTRCPIEEHYALPKDGYCHLWEKRNVTDDDYPERREE